MSATSPARVGSARAVRVPVPDGCCPGVQSLAALQAGRPGDPAVLLVPGYTGSKEDFGPILDPLAAAGRFVTALDLPGQYESAPLPDRDGYTTERLAAVVRATAVGLGASAHLVGHSFGGLVARAAVIAEPALFGSLVLMSSGPAQLGGARRKVMDALQPFLLDSGVPGAWAAMRAAVAADPDLKPPAPDVAEFTEQRFLLSTPNMLLGMAEALRTEPDRLDELATTGVATMVLHGVDDDAWSPAEQHAMAVRLGARYRVVPSAVHSPAVENPDATVRELLAFWGTTAR